MKKFIYFILVLVSTCMLSCKQSSVETSDNDETSNKDVIGHDYMCKKDGTFYYFGNPSVYTKDNVPFDLSQIGFYTPSEDKMTVENAIFAACYKVFQKYDSHEINSKANDIVDDIYKELKVRFNENTDVDADSIRLVNIFVTEHYPSSNRPCTIILK